MPFKIILALYFCTLISCTHMTHTPPDAEAIEKELTIHGDTRIDPYYWLNQRDNPQVIRYLEDENAYTKAILSPTEELQADLFAEMKARIKKGR